MLCWQRLCTMTINTYFSYIWMYMYCRKLSHRFLFSSNVYLFFYFKWYFQVVHTIEWNFSYAKKGSFPWLLYICEHDSWGEGEMGESNEALLLSQYCTELEGIQRYVGQVFLSCCLDFAFFFFWWRLNFRPDSGPTKVSGSIAINYIGSRIKSLGFWIFFFYSEENN